MVSAYFGDDLHMPVSNEGLLTALVSGGSLPTFDRRELSEFEEIMLNEPLRALLRAFLELDVVYMGLRQTWVRKRNSGRLRRWFGSARMLSLETQMKAACVDRDAAFKKYEVLRRLTCWDNRLLRRQPYY